MRGTKFLYTFIVSILWKILKESIKAAKFLRRARDISVGKVQLEREIGRVWESAGLKNRSKAIWRGAGGCVGPLWSHKFARGRTIAGCDGSYSPSNRTLRSGCSFMHFNACKSFIPTHCRQVGCATRALSRHAKCTFSLSLSPASWNSSG